MVHLGVSLIYCLLPLVYSEANRFRPPGSYRKRPQRPSGRSVAESDDEIFNEHPNQEGSSGYDDCTEIPALIETMGRVEAHMQDLVRQV